MAMSVPDPYEAKVLPGGLDPRVYIRDVAGRGASGQLIFSNGAERAVVFFQCGRLAWANDTVHKRAFVEHLKANTGVGQADIEAVVEECRKSRKPIGETLIEWQLATEEQVRDALRNQIGLALEVAARCCTMPPQFEPHEYGATHDGRFTFSVQALEAETPAPCPVVPLHPAQHHAGNGAAADASVEPVGDLGVADPATVNEQLKALASVEGFSGAALFTPAGEQLGVLEGDTPRLKEMGVVANALLVNAQKASLEMGAGPSQLVHVEAQRVQVLARCLNEGADPLRSTPGKAHIHLVIVLKSDASIGLAKLRVDRVIQKLAASFR
jgi:uncharacterized protein YfcZ (UPF0381/DUF406 family)